MTAATDEAPRSLDTAWSVAVAAAVVVGCLHPRVPDSTPVAVPAALVVVALVAGRRFPLMVAAALLASTLAARAEAGLEGIEPGVTTGETMMLVADPEPIGVGWRAEARRVDGRRVVLQGHGSPAWALADRVAGERVVVSGVVRPLRADSWLRHRHVAGRLTLDELRPTGSTVWWWRPANAFRSLVERGADALPTESRALYTGLVMGDDRFQTAAQQAQFRVAGLTHLLAVSGQNVAFVLAVLGPVARRVRRRWRVAMSLGVLVVFALATRLEPSVVRASVGAALMVTAGWSGSRSAGVRGLALTVAACCLGDPFLPRVVGFQLSVGASAGILVGARPLARAVPGPGWMTEPLAVTAAAQLGVLPILLTVFGPPSLVSLPANVAVGWAAGAVMTLGLTVGLVAAVLPAWAAAVVQAPTAGLLWWIDLVAGASGRLPVGAASPAVLGVLAAGALIAARCRPAGRVAVAGIALALVVATRPTAPAGPVPVPGGGWFVPAAGESPSVLVLGGADPDLLEFVVERLPTIDLVVAPTGSRTTATGVADLRAVTVVGVVLAPPQHSIVGAHRVTGERLVPTLAGPVVLRPTADGQRLDVEVPGRASG